MNEPIKAMTRLTLDLSLTGIQKSVTVTQGDTNRRLEITLTDSGSPFSLPKKWTVALSAIKPDGTLLFNGCVMDHGKVIYDFASGEEIATCVGAYEAKLVVYDEAGDTVATPKIWINVIRKGMRDIASQDQFTAARELVRRIREVGEDLELLECLVEQGGPLASVVTPLAIPATAWVKNEAGDHEAVLPLPAQESNSATLLIPADEVTRKAAAQAALYVRADRPSLDAPTAVVVSESQPPRESLLFLGLTVKGNSYAVGDPAEGRPAPEEIERHPPVISFVGISAGGAPKKAVLNGNGGELRLTVENGRIYSITDYSTVTVLPPERETYMAHLLVRFPKTASTAAFHFPDGLSLYGTDPSLAAPGDNWELNIDSDGGILLMRKRALA